MESEKGQCGIDGTCKYFRNLCLVLCLSICEQAPWKTCNISTVVDGSALGGGVDGRVKEKRWKP